MTCRPPLSLLCALLLCLSRFAGAEPIHLQLRWHHQFQFAGYYAAIEQGYYREAGLDVVIHPGSPGVTPVAEVLTGRAHYGVANSELLLQRLRGQPLVALASVFQHSSSILLSRKERCATTPHDLIGRKVMLMDRQVDADFLAMFKNEGIADSAIELLPSSYQISDLAEGKVDAFNAYRTNEPFYLTQQGIGYCVLDPRNYGVDFYSDILFTSEEELRQHPERVRAFTAASLKGWRYAMQHPEEIITLLRHKYDVPKSAEHLRYEAETMRSLILPEVIEIGHMNPGRWEHMADTFVRVGMVRDKRWLDGFLHQPDPQAELAQSRRRLWLASGTAVLLGLIALMLYAINRKIRREVALRGQVEAELQRMAYSDALTGLPNRLQFFERADQLLKRERRDQGRLALCFIDLNDFKKINDQHGHLAGDAVLSQIGQRLRRAVRESDIVARFGGDEFVVLFDNLDTPADLPRLVDHLQSAIRLPIDHQGVTLHSGASIGTALFPDDGDQIDALLSHADQAMYRRKPAARSSPKGVVSPLLAMPNPAPAE
ncbi:MAG TPA: ABC transporter substrate-binding protein [Pseudomonadales bacterium]|nr:ABC transporter substrate-binding protein [Pseudomonadales bacterium]HMZ70879.1 ABC transporter substrate-binding protein [Pseudomonadales bacterium]HMZ91915.1 ABC transporter substrate-binding protein [Pseudomonadales bacterium]HNC76995.1 ABC transporter substrate-binding protein [Pseudomonadales bacterium]HND27604.1 ABC transporter substrate-binding protein [Pseudomonadales bacterium]